MQVPDYISPLIGYRAWSINEVNLLGACAHQNDIWIPLEVKVAECKSGIRCAFTDRIPYENCTCGIYAFKEFNGEMSDNAIIGEVYLWGKIVPHKKGWRAQYAYPKRFYRPTNGVDTCYNITSDVICKLSEIYQVPSIEFIKQVEYYNVIDYKSFKIYDDLIETDRLVVYTKHIALTKCAFCHYKHPITILDSLYCCMDCLSTIKVQKRIQKFKEAQNESQRTSAI